MAIFALIAGYLDGQKHEKEIDDLNGRLDQQRDQLNEQKGMGLGIAAIIGRRLEGIESKITDPQSKAELSELREEVVRKPALVYDGFDDRSYKWGNGEAYQYVHLRFRNGPTGGRAPEAAAKLSWSNSEQRPLFLSKENGKRPNQGNQSIFCLITPHERSICSYITSLKRIGATHYSMRGSKLMKGIAYTAKSTQ